MSVRFGAPPKAKPPSPAIQHAIERTVGSDVALDEQLVDAYLRKWRPLPEDALESFLCLSSSRDISSFVQKYGPLTEFDPESDEVLAGKRERRLSFQKFETESDKLRFLLRLRDVILDRHADVGEKREALKGAEKYGFYFAQDPDRQLSIYLSWRLRDKSKLGTSYEDGLLVPCVYCADLLTGLYALLLNSLIQGAPWATCRKCGTPFKRTNSAKMSCSVACRAAWNQRRWRKNQGVGAKKHR